MMDQLDFNECHEGRLTLRESCEEPSSGTSCGGAGSTAGNKRDATADGGSRGRGVMDGGHGSGSSGGSGSGRSGRVGTRRFARGGRGRGASGMGAGGKGAGGRGSSG